MYKQGCRLLKKTGGTWRKGRKNVCSMVCAVRKKVKSLSSVRLFATPWTLAYQASPSMEFSGKNTGVGCHFLLQGIFLI